MNKITFGLEQVHIAFVDQTSPTIAWETPIPIPGAVRLTPTAQGQSSTFYADNGPYFTITSNNGYSSELEMALIPDAILARMLGWQIDDNGMLVETSDAKPTPFALMGQVQGDQRNRRFVYYYNTAQRPAKEQTTAGETIEPNTDVLTMTSTPIEVNGRRIVKGDMELNDTNSAAYNAFFSAVTVPTFGEVNKSKLAANIALATSLEEALYTPESWAVLEEALTTATTVNTDPNVSQAQVDAANNALTTAIIGLVVII